MVGLLDFGFLPGISRLRAFPPKLEQFWPFLKLVTGEPIINPKLGPKPKP